MFEEIDQKAFCSLTWSWDDGRLLPRDEIRVMIKLCNITKTGDVSKGSSRSSGIPISVSSRHCHRRQHERSSCPSFYDLKMNDSMKCKT